MFFFGWLLDFLFIVMIYEFFLYFIDWYSFFGLFFDLVFLLCVCLDCIELVDCEEFIWVFFLDVFEGNCCVFVNDLIFLFGECLICILLFDCVEFICVLFVGVYGGDLIYCVFKFVFDLFNFFCIDFKLCLMFLLSVFGDFFFVVLWLMEEFCVGVL